MALSKTSVFAAWNTSAKMLPNALTFNFEYTGPDNVTQSNNVTGTSILVSNLLPNAQYRVAISVVSVPKNGTEYVLEGNFTTLAKGWTISVTLPIAVRAGPNGERLMLFSHFPTFPQDYAAPANVIAQISGEIATAASYNVTWTSDAEPVEASSFRIESCSSGTKRCVSNETSATYIVLPLDYFTNYDLKVTAIYELSLNQTQERSNQIDVQTPGTSEWFKAFSRFP